MMLPTATNEGISYMSANANTIMQNRKSTITSNVLNASLGIGASVGSFASGNIIVSYAVSYSACFRSDTSAITYFCNSTPK